MAQSPQEYEQSETSPIRTIEDNLSQDNPLVQKSEYNNNIIINTDNFIYMSM